MARHPPRKLAVILHADVSGSTLLVQLDETLAHERIQDATNRLSQVILRYGGIAHEVRGDALVAEFERASDAISASLAFQSENALANSCLTDQIRPQLRIGIAIGEVVIADHTITGLGVVTAQRLEQMAPAGGVCIHGAAYETVPKRLPFVFEDLGPQDLKGHDEVVRSYAVALAEGESLPPPDPDIRVLGAQLKRMPKPLMLVGALLAFSIVGAVLVWFQFDEPGGKPELTDLGALPIPDKPAIVVLPFENLSDDPDQEYFAHGITDDLITDLSKVSGLFVIDRNSSFVYKKQTPKIQEIAQELGVRYVLEGSVRKAGEQVRINAQLVDASTGGQMWAERYDGDLGDVFSLQDLVTSKIVKTLAVQLTSSERERIEHRATVDSEAYDSYLKGWEQFRAETPESFRTAISYFERSLDIDSNFLRANAALAATYWQIWKRYWHRELGMESPHDPLFKAEEFLSKASSEPDAIALQVRTSMLAQRGEHAEAITTGQRAVALDPNDAASHLALAGALNLGGQAKKALSSVRQAIRLNPHLTSAYLYELALSHFGLEEYQKAARALDKATVLNNADRWSLKLLIATDGHLGRLDDAKKSMRWAQANWGGLDPVTIRGVLFWYPFKDERDLRRLEEGLRKAGVPE